MDGDRELNVEPLLGPAPVRDQQAIYRMLSTCIRIASTGIPTTLVDNAGRVVARIVPPAEED